MNWKKISLHLFWLVPCVLILLGTLWSPCRTIAARGPETVDRSAAVYGSHYLLPYALAGLRGTVAEKVSEEELQVYDKIAALASKHPSPLLMNLNEAAFRLAANEPPRLMKSTEKGNPIEVNSHMLSRASLELDLPLLFKLLMHEYGHMVEGASWGERDKLAQNFENIVRAFYRSYPLTEKKKVVVLSFLSEDFEVVDPISDAEIQPSILVFEIEQGNYRDLTFLLLQELNKKFQNFQPLMTAVRSSLTPVLRPLLAAFEQGVEPMFEMMGSMGIMSDKLRTSLRDTLVKTRLRQEVHLAEIRNVRASQGGDGFVLVFGGQIVMTTSGGALVFQVGAESNEDSGEFIDPNQGQNIFADQRVPFESRLFLPREGSRSLSIEPRPQLDLEQVVTADEITFEGGSFFLAPTEKWQDLVGPEPLDMELILRHPDARLFVKGKRNSPQEPFVFEVPSYVHAKRPSAGILAEAILLNGRIEIPLASLIPIGSDGDLTPSQVPPSQIVAGPSLALLGVQQGRPVSVNQFSWQDPPFLMDSLSVKQPYFQSSELPIAFAFSSGYQLETLQVRMAFTRNTSVVKPEGGDGLISLELDGWRPAVARSGTLVQWRDTVETVTVPRDKIKERIGLRQKVIWAFSAPGFRSAGLTLKEGQGFYPPLFLPITATVVFRDPDTGKIWEETIPFRVKEPSATPPLRSARSSGDNKPPRCRDTLSSG